MRQFELLTVKALQGEEIGYLAGQLKRFQPVQTMQETKFLSKLVAFSGAFWGGENVSSYLKAFDFRAQLGQVFVEHVDVLAKFLLQAVQKSGCCAKEVRQFVLGFDVG